MHFYWYFGINVRRSIIDSQFQKEIIKEIKKLKEEEKNSISKNIKKYNNVIFSDESFQFEFLRTLSLAVFQAADISDCLEMSSKIEDGNMDSWYLVRLLKIKMNY